MMYRWNYESESPRGSGDSSYRGCCGLGSAEREWEGPGQTDGNLRDWEPIKGLRPYRNGWVAAVEGPDHARAEKVKKCVSELEAMFASGKDDEKLKELLRDEFTCWQFGVRWGFSARPAYFGCSRQTIIM
jgi:hypothetical protein